LAGRWRWWWWWWRRGGGAATPLEATPAAVAEAAPPPAAPKAPAGAVGAVSGAFQLFQERIVKGETWLSSGPGLPDQDATIGTHSISQLLGKGSVWTP